MPRPPSKHGLERRYKSWRKGKSKTSKSKGSLKHQLRGKQRLLAKVTEPERRNELEREIQALEQQIQERQHSERTRQNAKDSHGVRFLERQRLTRAERSIRKLLASASTQEETSRYERELQRIALDQIYVAHFPHDMKYIPLFRNGVRMVDTDNVRKLVKRATTRKRILNNINERATWIAADQYDRLPKEWSVELEKATFCAASKGGAANEAEINDDRFSSVSEQHSALLQAAEQAESALDAEEANKEETKKSVASSDSDSSSSADSNDSDSDEDDANPLKRAHPMPGSTTMGGSSGSNYNDDEKDDKDSSLKSFQEHAVSGNDDSSSDSDSSSSDDEDGTELAKGKSAQSSDSSSSSSEDDSSSDSDDSSKANEPVVAKKRSSEPPPTVQEDFDDFLMPATTNDTNVFEKAKQDAPQYVKGDKSKGWATQRQRPGQFKKRRVR